MQRLEITGETTEELLINAVNMLSLLVRGAQQSTAPAEQENVVAARSELLDDEKTTVLPPKANKLGKQAGKKAKVEPLPNDDISIGKTIEHDANEKPSLTLDGDIRPRLREIQQACVKRGLEMPAVIAYIQKLYEPFGIAKAEQLKPDQFEEFLEMSDAYLSGEA